MNPKKVFFLALATIILVSFLNARAQDEQPETRGLLIWEDQVPPSKVDAYEKGTKMMLETYGAHGFPHEVDIFASEDYRYFWVVSIDRFADIDTMYTDFNRIYKEMGEEANDKLDAVLEGTFTKTKVWTCLWRSDLSYMPENAVDSGDYRYWGFLYVKQGKQKEMREIMKEWVELYKSKGINRGFGGYVGDIGTDMPFMFYSERAKNPADYYAAGAEIDEQLGEEAEVLWKRTEALLRGFEPLRGWYRKDLSYFPDKN